MKNRNGTLIGEDEAKKVLISNQSRRVKSCQEDLKRVLEKHSCSLEISMTLMNNRHPIQSITVVPVAKNASNL